MRTFVITAAVILFSIIATVVATMVPAFSVGTVPGTTLNNSTIETFTGTGGITTSGDGQNAYYSQNINVINLLTQIVSGVIFIGAPLTKLGVPAIIAWGVNAAFGLLYAFDLYSIWRNTPW